MEYKLFDTPQFHDAAFYADRLVSDHINEPGHQPRMLRALREVQYLVKNFPIHSLADFGAGNGGFLNEVRKRHPHLQLWGYDMQPSNIQWAKEKYGVPVYSSDITNPTAAADAADIVVLTETLEHLVDPHGFLRNLFSGDGADARYVVASSPANETPEHHYEFHLWAWTETSFPDMFRAAGWTVEKHYVEGGTQFVVASRAPMSPEDVTKTRKRVVDYLIKTERHKQRILEIGGYQVAGFFAMGHFAFAQLEDPEEAIAAQKMYPWLTVSTRDWDIDADIIVEGTEVLVK
ncbi:MAG TPA: methyltransferase domain-containing protein [Terriglobia bacterium]|nr:methyltransferase domain-containing protein [Terriglobia bacterium]